MVKELSKEGGEIERIIAIDQKQIYRLKNSQSYLAINIEGGSNLATDWSISINGQRLNGPFIPAIALAQDLTLVHKEHDNYSIEQESILRSLCNVTGVSPLDLRQWYLIPVQFKNLQLSDYAKDLRVTIRKLANNNNTLYGAYNLSKNFSIMPSLFRFSWEKAFYGVENQEGLTDPCYDQKIDQTSNGGGPYIKILTPKNSILKANMQTNSTALTDGQLRLLKDESKSGVFSSKEFKLTFNPQDCKLVKREDNPYWLIRLSGKVDNRRDNKDERLILWTTLNFSSASSQQSNKKSICYISPWLPNYLHCECQKSGQSLHFDVCFPILIGAFSEPLNNIELHLLKIPYDPTKLQTAQESKNMHVECSVQIYQMNKSLSGIPYEIL